MRALIFDTSTVISLATNNLLWTLENLKKQFNGTFMVPESVHRELVDNPLKSKRYKLEALIIQELFDIGLFKIYNNDKIKKLTDKFLNMTNTTFMTKSNYIKIIDLAELESLVLADYFKVDGYVVDERTIRLLVEDPLLIANILRDKLHTKININYDNIDILKKEFGVVKILRSVELMLIAYKSGLFNRYIKKNKEKDFLDGLLWGLKLRGCSITENEIKELLNLFRG